MKNNAQLATLGKPNSIQNESKITNYPNVFENIFELKISYLNHIQIILKVTIEPTTRDQFLHRLNNGNIIK